MNHRIALIIGLSLTLSSCDSLHQVANEAIEYYENSTIPTSFEIENGLTASLLQGINVSVEELSKENAFFSDPLIKIAFPEEIEVVETTLQKIGLGSLSDSFVKELNKGAEKAVIKALPIFTDAIKQMSFQDAQAILLGNNHAATDYLKKTSSEALLKEFRPEIDKVLGQYGIKTAYQSLMQKYNTIPFVKPAETDLTSYVTEKTMEGLFKKVAEEEGHIRSDISARSTDLLKKVFGYADTKK